MGEVVAGMAARDGDALPVEIDRLLVQQYDISRAVT